MPMFSKFEDCASQWGIQDSTGGDARRYSDPNRAILAKKNFTLAYMQNLIIY